jgi:toxin CcdB
VAQFDVHKNTEPSRNRVPFLLDIQADLLKVLATRVVVPLVRPDVLGDQLIRHLHVEVDGKRLVALVSELAAVPARALGPRVASLAHRRADLVRAFNVTVAGV